MSPMLTMARSRPSTTTGMWRTRRSVMVRARSSIPSSGVHVTTSVDMIWDTRWFRTSAPARCNRVTTSRSLTMPATVAPSSSLTTTAPMRCSSRMAIRCSTVSLLRTVTTRSPLRRITLEMRMC